MFAGGISGVAAGPCVPCAGSYPQCEPFPRPVRVRHGYIGGPLRRDLCAGIRYLAHPALTLRANAGVFPRLPEFGELFGDTGDVVGNTRLEEERGTNFDTGAHYSSGGGVFDLDAAVFHRFAKDLIQTRNYGDYLISENIGKAAITGGRNLGGAEPP